MFLEKYHSYLPPDKEGRSEEKDRRIDLSINFRSRESVLQGVNGVFAQLMRESVGGIAYDDRAALYPGASFLEEDKREGRTAGKSELLLYEEIRGEEDRDRRYWEAKMVAQRIRQLVKGPKPLLVQDNNRLRPISYRDIVILLRTGSGWSEQFAEVLGKAGIPSFADTSRGYFDSMEVLHFLSFLSAIDNPYIDILVAGFLKSTLVGFFRPGAGFLDGLVQGKPW